MNPTNRRRIALIGAGGFFGTNLARYLHSENLDVRCYGLTQHFPEAMNEICWESGAIEDDKLTSFLSKCDTVVHLASSSTPGTDLSIIEDAQNNLVTSLTLFEKCIAANVKQLIFISSGGTVYGVPKRIPITEESTTTPITPYGVTKLAIEKYLSMYSRIHGLEYRILRISNLYGPYQINSKMHGVIPAFLIHAIRQEPLEVWGNGSVVRDFVFVDDAANAVHKAINYEGQQRVFNIGSGLGVSLLELSRQIQNLFEHNVQVKFKPGRKIDVPANILDCSLAHRHLNWKATTKFDDGLLIAKNWLERWTQKK